MAQEETNELEKEVAEAEDIEVLKQTLAAEREKTEGYLANWQRAQADFINYKRRSEQEKAETSNFAKTTLILNLLPVLDDLERALTSIPPHSVKRTWLDGIRLIERKFRASLETEGLSEIKTLGEPFDPHLHEAVRNSKGEEGVVVEEIQKGYKFRDRIIRPAMVVVGNGQQEENKED